MSKCHLCKVNEPVIDGGCMSCIEAVYIISTGKYYDTDEKPKNSIGKLQMLIEQGWSRPN